MRAGHCQTRGGGMDRRSAWSLCSLLVVACCSINPAAAAFFDAAPAILPAPSLNPSSGVHDFTLRHVFHHGTRIHPGLHQKLDITPATRVRYEGEELGDFEATAPRELRIESGPLHIQRLVDRSDERMEALMEQGRKRGSPVVLPSTDWTVDTVSGPNITDKGSVLTLSRMCLNAYLVNSTDPEWEPVKGGFNYTRNFGWEQDGVRGHIFADENNQTVIIAFKGTTPAVWDGTETTTRDKENDNLFFSCCCGQGGPITWRQVCDCQTSTYTCNSTCVVEAMRNKDRYYAAAQEIYGNVTEKYPDAEIWLTGHSLGGSLASLLGARFGVPVVSFEAVPDALAAARLGLPTPPKYRIGSGSDHVSTGAYHFGHTADPVFTGSCWGATASCSIAGYALQSVCHTGQKCVYDTIKDKGWHNYMGNHGIKTTVHDVINSYDEVPRCFVEEECTDCYEWKFYQGNPSSITKTATSTSTTSTYSRTRTATCQTPGWWGCLDETTTTTSGTTTSTTTASTSTCRTPGWFSCLDRSTTTTTTTATHATTTSHRTTSTTCHTPGWFWCRDRPTSTATRASPAPTKTTPQRTATSTSTSTCHTPGWFGCHDETTTSRAKQRPTTTAPGRTTSTTSTCKTPGFFWGCRDRPTGEAAHASFYEWRAEDL